MFAPSFSTVCQIHRSTCSWSGARRHHGRVVLLEDDDAAFSQRARDLANGIDLIALVHEDASSDEGVERAIRRRRRKVADHERDPRGTALARIVSSRLYRAAIAIHADHFPRVADDLCEEEAHVAAPASDVDHAHSSGHPRVAKESFREFHVRESTLVPVKHRQGNVVRAGAGF